MNGTIFEELLKAMQGDEIVSDLESAKVGEQVVGQMNALEISLCNLAQKNTQAAKDLVSDLKACEEKPSLKFLAKLKSYHVRAKSLISLMWDSIETRLADKDTNESSGWAIRANHQIVLLPPKKTGCEECKRKDDCPSSLQDMLSDFQNLDFLADLLDGVKIVGVSVSRE